jgi:hypothetical protein
MIRYESDFAAFPLNLRGDEFASSPVKQSGAREDVLEAHFKE